MRHMPPDTDEPLNPQAQKVGSLPPIRPAPDGTEEDTSNVTLARAGADGVVGPQGGDPSGCLPLGRKKPAREFAGLAQRHEAPKCQDAGLDIVEAAKQIVEANGTFQYRTACDVDPHPAIPVRKGDLLLSSAGENYRRDVGKRREVECIAIRA